MHSSYATHAYLIGVVCVGLDVTATNAARGRQAELEQQMDAVLVKQ
jgi:hypothetical protein